MSSLWLMPCFLFRERERERERSNDEYITENVVINQFRTKSLIQLSDNLKISINQAN